MLARKVFSWVVLFALALAIAEAKGTLQALLVLDTVTNLRESIEKDKTLLLESLDALSKASNLECVTEVLEGKDVTAKNVQSWLSCMKKNRPEVLCVYFVGHGHSQHGSKWPLLLFHSRLETMPLERLEAYLEEARPRLTILLSDCCNASRDPGIPNIKHLLFAWGQKLHVFHQRKPALWKSLKQDEPSLRQLLPGSRVLMSHKGHIMATAASKGNVALAIAPVGGVFTLSFLSSLLMEASCLEASWKRVLQNTQELCLPLQESYGRVL